MRATARVALALALALGMEVADARAFIVLKHWQSGETTVWTSLPIQWSMSTKVLEDIPAADLEKALQAAFDSWESIECSTVAFSYQGQKSSDPDTGIHVTFKTSGWDPSVGDALAYSVSDSDSDGTIYSNDVVFNGVDAEWSTAKNTPNGKKDVQGVASHEIGHSIGMAHTRYVEATMFFTGGSEDLRSLEADDQAGACFLYPAVPFTSGKACDACTAHSNCAYGYCLKWGGGHSYCGQHCSVSSDCPDGYECAQFTGFKQCIPSNEYCHAWGSNIDYGEPCYGHETCASGLCLGTGAEAYCSKSCTSTANCPAQMICESGYCLATGNLAFGEECEIHSDCESGFCYEISKTLLCTQPCGKNGGSCPPKSQCIQDVICIPPGPRPNGAPCYYPDQCVGTYCQDLACTQPCDWGCPADTTCVDGFCQGATSGGSCASGAECPDELYCMIPSGKDSGSCEWTCNPTTEEGCPDTRRCQWWWDTEHEKVSGICKIPNQGAGLDESCEDELCEVDLVCTLGGGATKTCHRDCKLKANDLGCAFGQDCIDLGIGGDPLHGACVWPDQPRTELAPQAESVAADAGAPAGDAAGTPPGAEVESGGGQPDASTSPDGQGGAAESFVPAQPSAPSGCSDAAPGGWWWVLAGLAAAWARRRPTRRSSMLG